MHYCLFRFLELIGRRLAPTSIPMGAKTMKTDRSDRFPSTILLATIVLAVLLPLGTTGLTSAVQAETQGLVSPAGFTYADAHLDRDGTGFVLWKNTDGLTSELHRVRAFEVVASWDLPGFLGKGLRVADGDRVLLMGVSPEGADLRLVTPRGEQLGELWTSSTVSDTNRLDEEQLSVSNDLRWWYGARFQGDETEVIAGPLTSAEPSFRWSVPTPAPDPFLSVLVDVTSDADSLRLALSADGAGWLLSSETSTFEPLVLPEACPGLVSLSSGRDGLWAHCESGVHALYPADLPVVRGPVEPTAVVATGALRVLSDGTAVSLERRRGAPGTLRVVERKPDGAVEMGAESIPFPVPLGEIGHIAGSQLLLPLKDGSDGGADRETFRALPLNVPSTDRG